jgi:hypothetical protein
MKATFITLGLLLATASAAPRSLKSLLQQEATLPESLNPGSYGFASNCTFTSPPGPGGSGTPPPVIVGVCQCALSANGTGEGLPPLGSATSFGFSQGATVSQGQAVVSNPDTEVLNQVAAEVCSCETSTH